MSGMGAKTSMKKTSYLTILKRKANEKRDRTNDIGQSEEGEDDKVGMPNSRRQAQKIKVSAERSIKETPNDSNQNESANDDDSCSDSDKMQHGSPERETSESEESDIKSKDLQQSRVECTREKYKLKDAKQPEQAARSKDSKRLKGTTLGVHGKETMTQGSDAGATPKHDSLRLHESQRDVRGKETNPQESDTAARLKEGSQRQKGSQWDARAKETNTQESNARQKNNSKTLKENCRKKIEDTLEETDKPDHVDIARCKGKTVLGHGGTGLEDIAIKEKSSTIGGNTKSRGGGTSGRETIVPKETDAVAASKNPEENNKENVWEFDLAKSKVNAKEDGEAKPVRHNSAARERHRKHKGTNGNGVIDASNITDKSIKGRNQESSHSGESSASKEKNTEEKASDTKQTKTGDIKEGVPRDVTKESRNTGNQGSAKTTQPPWNLCVKAVEGGMSDLDVDVIVSSEDASLQGLGMVAKQLEQKGGKAYVAQKSVANSLIGDLRTWQFIYTPGAGGLQCKSVAHVNIPRLGDEDQESWCRQFGMFISRLVMRTNCMGFTSMAVPLFGTGRFGAPTDFIIDLLCTQISNSSKTPVDKPWLQTIYIVHPNKKVVRDIERTIKQMKLHHKPEMTGKSDVTTGKKKTRDDGIKNKDKSFMEKYSVKMSKAESASKDCPICMETIDLKERVELNKCHHVFCLSCIQQSFDVKPSCPLCNVVYGTVRGHQPNGYIFEVFDRQSLPGFEECGLIRILYSFFDGIQDDAHPNPGKPYRGARREAFLPDNAEGQKVHRLLRKSFQQRVTFTIGSSRTTGREDVVTWNDIHHKTRIHGGPERYGYPDPEYLTRVQEELAAKGISETTDS
ncbi:DNA ligase 1-like [Argopecten irradians]|uniref:DNA ligase 1-like n=1 Tax=Argopecten irradians TaxID=31199 RepID=UPI00371060CB